MPSICLPVFQRVRSGPASERASAYSSRATARTRYSTSSAAKLKFLAAPDGTPCLIGHLKAGDFFGAGSLLGLRQRRTTAIAATPCTIVRLEKLAVLNALYQYPDIADLFISFLVDRNRHYRETLPVRRGIAATKLIQD